MSDIVFARCRVVFFSGNTAVFIALSVARNLEFHLMSSGFEFRASVDVVAPWCVERGCGVGGNYSRVGEHVAALVPFPFRDYFAVGSVVARLETAEFFNEIGAENNMFEAGRIFVGIDSAEPFVGPRSYLAEHYMIV